MISEATGHILLARFAHDFGCAQKNATSSFAYKQERWARVDLMTRILEMSDEEMLRYGWDGQEVEKNG
jgi:hypothetical protein